VPHRRKPPRIGQSKIFAAIGTQAPYTVAHRLRTAGPMRAPTRRGVADANALVACGLNCSLSTNNVLNGCSGISGG
jgi:hypothetical protein